MRDNDSNLIIGLDAELEKRDWHHARSFDWSDSDGLWVRQYDIAVDDVVYRRFQDRKKFFSLIEALAIGEGKR